MAIVEVENWNDLDAIRNDLAGDYVLVNDIDQNSAGYDTHASETANDGEGWLALGDNEDPFTGSFDGQGFTISDLFMDRPSTNNVGVFGVVESNNFIKNVGVLDVDITGNVTVAGLIGWLSDGNGLVIENCYSTGSITATRDETGGNAGGLIGTLGDPANVTIKNCYSTCDVTQTNDLGRIGGFIGHWDPRSGNQTISKCYSTGLVTTTATTGGFIGTIVITEDYDDDDVDNCFWDTETSGRSDPSVDVNDPSIVVDTATGKTTAEMKDRDTFTDTATTGLSEAWDMALVDTYDETKTWGIGDLGSTTINDGYPFLMTFQVEPQPVISHTADILTFLKGIETHTTDLLTFKQPIIQHSVDIITDAPGLEIHTVDIITQKTDTKTHTVDTLAFTENVVTNTTDIITKIVGTETHTVDISTLLTLSESHTVDIATTFQATEQHTIDLITKSTFVKTHTVDILIEGWTYQPKTTDTAWTYMDKLE